MVILDICIMTIAEQLTKIKNSLNEDTTLVAVSKTKPVSDIMEAYGAGHHDFGENKVQELCDKHPELPDDIRWHFIGHLQRNKVKYIVPFVHLIHGVDSLRLLKEVNKRALQNDVVVNCLLQIHIAEEATKYGLDLDELMQILSPDCLGKMSGVRVKGLMGMATNTDDVGQVRKEFESLRQTYDQCLKIDVANWQPEILSMGMSGDFPIALECGSNMVRIGSAIFGARNQH